MVRTPKVLSMESTIGDARREFTDDHVHMLVIVDNGTLLGTLLRSDLDDTALSDTAPALCAARNRDRTVDPDAHAADLRHAMRAQGIRRLAVVTESGHLEGLLCLKRSGRGFCSDNDVQSRRVAHNSASSWR